MRRTPRPLLLLALVGCGSIIGPEYEVPPDAARTEPLETYAAWYAEVEACTAKTGDFAEVRWFEVPGERWWDPLRQQYAIGTWRAPHDIYLTTAHLDDEWVVKHEVVHDLLHGGATYDPLFGQCSHITH